MDEEQISRTLDTIAAGFRGDQRAPVIGTPRTWGWATRT